MMKPRYDLPAPWSASVTPRALVRQLAQQLLDELEQVVDLLELAPRILVEPALAGEDVQFLQQLDGLAWPQTPAAASACGLRTPLQSSCSMRCCLRWGPTSERGPAVRRPALRASRMLRLEDRLGLAERPRRRGSMLSSRSRCSVG